PSGPFGFPPTKAPGSPNRVVAHLEIVVLLPRRPLGRTPPLCPGTSDVPSIIGIGAPPAHHLVGRVILGPFRDFRRGEEHALGKRAPALEIEMLGPAFLRVRHQADREDEIDETHSAPRCRPTTSSRCIPAAPGLCWFADSCRCP